jgi:hypothetical protein
LRIFEEPVSVHRRFATSGGNRRAGCLDEKGTERARPSLQIEYVRKLAPVLVLPFRAALVGGDASGSLTGRLFRAVGSVLQEGVLFFASSVGGKARSSRPQSGSLSTSSSRRDRDAGCRRVVAAASDAKNSSRKGISPLERAIGLQSQNGYSGALQKVSHALDRGHRHQLGSSVLSRGLHRAFCAYVGHGWRSTSIGLV